MITIARMYISPVKALALQEIGRAYLDKPGIPGDRAFYIVDSRGHLFTQREFGPLVQVQASYEVSKNHLTLTFPDGETLAGVTEPVRAVTTAFWEGRPVQGWTLAGRWNEALSEFAGQELRLIKADRAGQSFDGYPLSMCSVASLKSLAAVAGVNEVDGRRFRQNVYLEGATPHQEDEWLGGEVRVGSALLRVKMRDPRCAVTTLSPDTGQTDLNTLKLIASYRTDQPREVNFGVYCTVAEPGMASVGNAVEPLVEVTAQKAT
jgi:uncharacterized protein